MVKPSDEQQRALGGLLGLGSHSARKSHYPELAARLDELEAERNRYKWLFETSCGARSLHRSRRPSPPT